MLERDGDTVTVRRKFCILDLQAAAKKRWRWEGRAYSRGQLAEHGQQREGAARGSAYV